MTEREKMLCDVLSDFFRMHPDRAYGPTEIARIAGIGTYTDGAADPIYLIPVNAACSALLQTPLKRMIKEGVVVREKGGKYRAAGGEQ